MHLPASRILVVDDDAAVCWALGQALGGDGFDVSIAADAGAARRLMRRHDLALVITDVRMPGDSGLDLLGFLAAERPGLPVVVTTAYGTVDTAVDAVARGAYGYLPKPLDLGRTLDLVRRACGRQALALSSVGPTAVAPSPDGLVGSSPAMQEVYRRIAAAAASDVGVLITGPSGTGKELAARSIHRFSARRDAPFVAINCGAIPASLVESELFGHVAGAFTGAATARGGRVQSAAGGVLFLDEVGELPPAAQASLLRFLDQHVIVPVGGGAEQVVDVRVIAATNRELAPGPGCPLRADLYWRLRGVTLAMPSLAGRPQDLPELVGALLARASRRLGRPLSLTAGALAAIAACPWPGNVRELKHRLEEAAVFAPGGIIGPEHLALDGVDPEADFIAALSSLAARELTLNPGAARQRCLDQVLPALFTAALERSDGSHLRAAELLGIHRTSLKRWIDGISERA